MVYHGSPWSYTYGHTTIQTTMVIQPWSIMVDHGRPCFVKWPPMVDIGLINTMSNHGPGPWSIMVKDHGKRTNQRTNGPVNAHLISWHSKAQKIQNLQYSHTFIISISCLHLPTFRSKAAIFSEKSTVFTFSHRKA